MTLEELVDDYLTKHYAAVKAGRERERIMREPGRTGEHEAVTDKFVILHNERAAAFRALCDARGIKP